MDIFDRLIEATPKQLMRKQKSITRLFPTHPDRVRAVADRGGIRLNGVEYGLWRFKIHSGTKKNVWYDAVVSFKNVKKLLADIVRDRRLWVTDKTKIDRTKLARKFMNKVNVQINCSCPADLYYGGQYIRSLDRYDAKAGDQETRPPKEKNPKQYGAYCKHLQNLMKVLPFYNDTAMKWLGDFYDEEIKEIEQRVKQEYGWFKVAAGELKKKKDKPKDRKHRDRKDKDDKDKDDKDQKDRPQKGRGRKDRHQKDRDKKGKDSDKKDRELDKKGKDSDKKDRELDKKGKDDTKDKKKDKKKPFDAPYESIFEAVAADPEKELVKKYPPAKSIRDLKLSTFRNERWYKFWLLTNGKLVPVSQAHGDINVSLYDLLDIGAIRGYIDPDNGELNIQTGRKLTRRQIITLSGMFIPLHIKMVHTDIAGKHGFDNLKSSKELEYLLTYGTLDEAKLNERADSGGWVHPNGEVEFFDKYSIFAHEHDSFAKLHPGKYAVKTSSLDEYMALGHIRFVLTSEDELNITVAAKPTSSQMLTLGKWARSTTSFLWGIESDVESKSYWGDTWRTFVSAVSKMQ